MANLGQLNDTLQFIGQEEGRIRYDALKSSLVFDYFLKDLLGNVRMVLTNQKDTAVYPAVSYETATIANESIYYDSVDVGRTSRPGDFYDNTTNGSWVQLLRKSTHSIGAGKLLKVMAKDRIHVKVDYYMPNDVADNSNANGLNSVVSVLANLINSASPALHGAGTTIASNLNSSVPFTDFLSPQNGSGGSMPKAYLNILFFDEQFRFVNANSEIVRVDTKGSGRTIYRLDGDAKEAPKNGYVYVYVSNESNNLVYFDNLQITHEKGPIMQETHYYPFGLTMAAISSKAMGKMETVYKFNGGTELDNDLGLAIYETPFRGYDAQIGRFGQIDPMADSYADCSPYCFAFNDPVFWNDPTGADPNYDINNVWDLLNYIQQYGVDGFSDGATKFLFDNNGNLTDVLYSSDPYLGYLKGVFGLWMQYGTWTNNSYKDDMFQVLGTSYQTATFVPSAGYIDNSPQTPALGEDMTNPWDWVYQLNNFNPLANVANGINTYFTGQNTYGISQDNYAATAQIISAIPVGKLAAIGESVVSPAVRQYSVAFEMKLANNLYPGKGYSSHFKAANTALGDAMSSDATFANSMSGLGIQIPRSSTGTILGKSPAGWVWHHNVEAGVMQLVPKGQHTSGSAFWGIMHPGGLGGMSLWGK